MPYDYRSIAEWSTKTLSAWGYRPDDAAFIADSLLDADLRGLASHGVIRLPAYEQRVVAGLVDPLAEPEVVTRTGSACARINGNNAAGQLVARRAVRTVSELAKSYGIGAVSVNHSAHFGAAGHYARMLATDSLIGLVVSNSEPIVVPHGGRDPLFGTNPFAFAAPTESWPLSLDMATSTSAMGKVLVAQAKGESIPTDWGINSDGEPTEDPNEVVALLPAAGPKGSGLALLIETLAGVLAEAAFTTSIGNMYSDLSKPQNVGHFFIAIDPTTFLPLAKFKALMESLLNQVRSSTPAPGFDQVLAPGDPEHLAHTTRSQSGVELAPATVSELDALGKRWDTPFPKELK